MIFIFLIMALSVSVQNLAVIIFVRVLIFAMNIKV